MGYFSVSKTSSFAGYLGLSLLFLLRTERNGFDLAIYSEKHLRILEHFHIFSGLLIGQVPEVLTTAIADKTGTGNDVKDLFLFGSFSHIILCIYGTIKGQAIDFPLLIAYNANLFFKGVTGFNVATNEVLHPSKGGLDGPDPCHLTGLQDYHRDGFLQGVCRLRVKFHLLKTDGVAEMGGCRSVLCFDDRDVRYRHRTPLETIRMVEVESSKHALKIFFRFVLAKSVVTYGLELMLAFLDIIQGVIGTILNAAGLGQPEAEFLPQEIVTAIEECGFFDSIPLWAITLIGGLFVWVLSFVMILNVYGRFFKLYMYTAISPIPLSCFAGEPTQNVGKSFLKSYAGVCMEGAIIVLACIIFSVFASTPPTVDPTAAAAAMVWSYIGELIFNMLILVGAVKMADRIVREMMGL